MKNYDTTHRGKCAAPYREQLMLNHCGDKTVLLPGSTLPGIAETFYSVKINLHFAVIPSIDFQWYIFMVYLQLLRWPFQ